MDSIGYSDIAVWAITEVTGLTQEQLQSSSRTFGHVIARQIVFEYLIGKGLHTIPVGRIFNRHHATVLHGIRQIHDLVRFDRKGGFIKYRFDCVVSIFEAGEEIVIGTA